MRSTLIILFAVVTLSAKAQQPSDLTGRRYVGSGEAHPTPGCEGCGNRGSIEFLPNAMVDYLLPGSDIMERRTYTRQGALLTLEGGGIAMEVRGDSLYVDAYGHRHPYVADRDLR